MKTVEEALQEILDSVRPLEIEQVTLLDSLNRVLARDINSSRFIPPRDNSAMDGYALRSEDIMSASRQRPVTLRCVEEIPAGGYSARVLASGEAARIMTGAPIPEGADTVVKIEDVTVDAEGVTFYAPSEKGVNIRRRGEDVVDGETILTKGTPIGPAQLGMLAATGNALVPLYRRPVVAIIATGDELIAVDGDPSPGKIVSSNSYTLYGQVVEAGAVPLPLGIARDTREDLLAHFTLAKERADVIVSSGGVSMGDYDYVRDVLRELGAEVRFESVAQRPGKPFTFALLNGLLLFGVPGNPVSAMVSFEQYIRPAIRKMTGHRALFRRTVKATLEEPLTKKGGFTYFLRGLLTGRDGRFTVTTTGDQGSGILKSMARANCIIVLPRHMTTIESGSEAAVQVIDNSLLAATEPGYLEGFSA